MKLNIKNIINILSDVRDYVFPIKKITNKFRNKFGVNNVTEPAIDNVIR